MTKIPFEVLNNAAFVLNLDKLTDNLELMKRVQKESGAKILLALKGFSMWSVFPLIEKYLEGATASSLYEARLIYEEMGVKAHTYSPAFNSFEFDEICNFSSHISFNSLQEWERYQSKVFKNSVSLGLRINPEYSDVKTAIYNPADSESRLGIIHSEFPNKIPEGIEGLHMHTLCESSADAMEKLLMAFENNFAPFISSLKWVNLGGGHLMTKEGYDVDKLIQLLQNFRNKYKVEVFLEPGSAVVWDTGNLVTHILDIVSAKNIKTAILDVSFTAHMPDTLEMPYRPEIIGSGSYSNQYRIGGVSCLAGDFLEVYGFEQPLKIGQQLIFKDMMHYTMVKTTMFNGVQHPDIYTWSEKDGLKCIKKFNYSDFKNRLS